MPSSSQADAALLRVETLADATDEVDAESTEAANVIVADQVAERGSFGFGQVECRQFLAKRDQIVFGVSLVGVVGCLEFVDFDMDWVWLAAGALKLISIYFYFDVTVAKMSGSPDKLLSVL